MLMNSTRLIRAGPGDKGAAIKEYWQMLPETDRVKYESMMKASVP